MEQQEQLSYNSIAEMVKIREKNNKEFWEIYYEKNDLFNIEKIFLNNKLSDKINA